MGNLHCGLPTVYDEDFDIAVARKKLEQTTLSYLNCQSSAIVNDRPLESRNKQPLFIKAHLRDRPRNVLLEYNLVTEALVEQVEELVRRQKERELLEDCTSSIKTTESGGGLDGSTGDALEKRAKETEVSMGRAGSEFAQTVITTTSGATEIAGNAKKRNQKPSAPKQSYEPHLMGGNEFALREDMRRSIKKVVVSTVQTTGCENEPCSGAALFAPCAPSQRQVWLNSNNVSIAVDDEMLVLHLKMPNLKCYRYYRMHLSRWKPHNPLSLVIENGIETTNLTPLLYGGSKLHVPDLGTVSDDSSASHNSAVDFGTSPMSYPVQLLVTDSVFLDLAITGSLGLNQKKRRPKACIDRKLLKSPDQYIVLLNRRSGIPIAVCALKTPCKGPPVVRIFTTKRRVFGQTKAATTKQLGLTWWKESLPLYPWAEIVTEGAYPETVRYSIFLTTGSHGEFEEKPSYKATHSHAGSPEIRVVGRTEREATHSGCAILNMCQAESRDEVFMKVSIGRGIDPALMICFAAFIDEVLEKTMRTEYNKSE